LKTRKNIILISTSSIIILTLAIVSGYQYWNYRSFTALVNQAQTSLQSEDYAKAISLFEQAQAVVEEKAKAEQIAQAAAQKAKNSQEISSPEAAGQLVFERVYKNNPSIGYVFGSDPEMYNGVECYGVKAYSRQMRADGGTGTVGVFQVEINTGSIWDLYTEKHFQTY